MKHLAIKDPSQTLLPDTWFLSGTGIVRSEKNIRQLAGIFEDETAWQLLDPDTLVYRVQSHLPVAENTPGGLYFGTTTIFSGRVGDEYFMTHGHFHLNADRGEYYWGVQGMGMLIMMNARRITWAERVFRGSLHYIAGNTAHRVANTGKIPLIFGACWPSDAGHDYEIIDRTGFSARLKERDGNPCLVDSHP